MRYQTALILSAVAIIGIFGMPMASHTLLAHYVESGQLLPFYGRVFLLVAMYCAAFWWILAPATVGALIFIAALTANSRPRKQLGRSLDGSLPSQK
jgi:hypothetical protein